MANQTSSSIVIAADRSTIMDVIADFGAYPEWAQGVKVADVTEPGPEGGRPKAVYFEVDVKPISDSYTLVYDWNGDDGVTWRLGEGKMMKAIDGEYALRALSDDSTEVTYSLTVDMAIPMIGMLRRKAEKVIIDSALGGLKKRVESR
ncbi:MAG: SRPBCC family protein [Nocardioidaceae bacterium]